MIDLPTDPDVLSIGGQAIPRGESAQLSLHIASLVTHTPIHLRLRVNRAVKAGPVVLLMAGLHGDEHNGVEILRRLRELKATVPTRGTVIVMPLVNVFGFLQFAREVPDGKDVNRSFPGSATGSLASRIAHTVTKQVLPHVHLGIDYHTGGGSRTNYPQLRASFLVHPELRPLADLFAAPMLLNSGLIDHSLRKEAHKRGVKLLVYEGGENLRFDEQAVVEGVKGSIRFLHGLDMCSLPPEAPQKPTVVMRESRWVRARASGFFHPEVTPGQAVHKNQVMATLTDPFGDTSFTVKSPIEGYIIGQNSAALLHQGDALFHIGEA